MKLTGPLRAHGPDHLLGQLIVRRTCSEQASEVELAGCEKAGAELALRGQADPIAVATEGPRNGRDDAHLAPTVQVAPTVGGGRSSRRDGLQRVHGRDGAHDLVLADD